MLFFDKKIGETPLEMLNRVREQKPELKDVKLSYVGRLDPMAKGQMLVLEGEENKEYKKYLGFDKEYEATFLFGVGTDTGDILGLITDQEDFDFNKQKINQIERDIVNFKNIKKQKYPWFSSFSVGGLKLFDHFKKGNLNIERPTRKVSVKKVEIIKFEEVSTDELKEYIFNNIRKVKGDFRQDKILKKWESFFDSNSRQKFTTVKVKLLVSTGTYIRGLNENLSYPSLLLRLDRTKIVV